ncbi:MAG: prepilin-type N-terminal cleavage/methylation domain-containing protein [Candidatus Omnitrophota bacterium]
MAKIAGNPTRKQGLTLIEIIVVLAISGVLVLSLVALAIFSNAHIERARRKLTAVSFAHSVMEDLLFETDFSNPVLNNGTYNFPTVNFAFPTGDVFWSNFNPSGYYNVTGYEIDPGNNPGDFSNAKEVTVIISWDESFPGGTVVKNEVLNSIKVKK